MHSPDPNFNAEQDAQLRAVPLPEGLLERLRRTALADDDGLDAAIRGVPLPAGFAQRLRCAVLSDDEVLDAAVREVTVPVDLLGRLRRLPKRRKRLASLAPWATAVSLLIVIGLSYGGAMLGFLTVTFHDPVLTAQQEISASAPADLVFVLPEPELTFVEGAYLLDENPPRDGSTLPAELPLPRIDLAEFVEPGSKYALEGFNPLAPSDSFATVSLLGTSSRIADLDELRWAAGPKPQGIGLPLVPGVPWDEYIRTGFRPYVFPAADTQLQTSLVPLDAHPSSYDLTRRYLEDGKLPPPKDVRTEEFLAALDYDFPAPKSGGLGLYTAAGPSPFPGEGICMLQVGVQARELLDQRRPAVRLVVAVDVSKSMRWGGRLKMIRRALADVVRQLGPADRLTLVAFSEEARVLIEDCGREDEADLLSAVELLQAANTTNLGAGLRKAYAMAPRGSAIGDAVSRVVLLTDGWTNLDTGAAGLIEQRLANARRQGIILEVIDLKQKEESNLQLASLAQSGGGTVRAATSADQIRWAMLEIITGRPQLVAVDARLKVTFDPKEVMAYRLLGHEANVMAGLLPAKDLEIDFRAGQSATALYEIRLMPGRESGSREVATVELTWQDPGGGKIRQLTRKVRGGDFSAPFIESPLSLQGAVVAAQAAEVLRMSPYAQRRGLSMAHVLELARHVDTRLYEWPSFVEFVSMMERVVGEK